MHPMLLRLYVAVFVLVTAFQSARAQQVTLALPRIIETERLAVSVTLGFMVVYLAYYFASVRAKPQIITRKNGSLHQFLLKHCTFATELYAPPIWCFEARMQTILRAVFRKCLWEVPYRKEKLQLPDGGEVLLHWVDNDANNKKYPNAEARPTVLFLPGLTGSYQEDYVKNMVRQVQLCGYRAVVYNYRGIADATLRTPKLYCALSVHDVAAVVGHIKKNCPKAPVIAFGVSLGGIMLTNYLAYSGENSQLVAGFVSSACWNLVESSRNLEKPLNWLLFNRYLASLLVQNLSKHLHVLRTSSEYDLDRVLQAKTVRQFDHHLTAKMFGYATAEEYYQEASLYHKIGSVKTPLVSLSAADDPFAPLHTLPLDLLNQSSKVAMVLTSHGGHIGFLEGLLLPRTTLLERAVAQFSTSVFENISEWSQVAAQNDTTDIEVKA